ncbi:MAG: diguanylate cyclase [Spirochaetales bacterium]|nr:diguanylate cyclase [Spirochaetales bacterium]
MNYRKIINKFRELGLFIQDLKHDKSYPNLLWEEWGYTAEEMTRYGYLSFVHPDDRDYVQKATDRFNRGDEEFSRIVFRIKDKKENWHWILSSCLAVERDQKGQVLEYVGFDHDITQEIVAREQAEKALREAETLISASAAITAVGLDLPHTIGAILEQAGRVISFDSASVQLVEEREGAPEMMIVGGIGFPREKNPIGARFPMTGLTPNSRIMEERKTLVLSHEEIAGYHDFAAHAYADIHCWMGVPLISRDRLLGMMTFDRLRDDPYTPADKRLAQAFSNHIAIALENSQLYEETKKMAITDPLTGCYTRRRMLSELEKECESSRRHGFELGVIMMDLDDFKNINDTYGHLAGDGVLKKVASLAERELRKSDILCRIGGEEFLMILPHTEKDAVIEVAERVRRVIEEEASLEGMDTAVTVSMGCARLLDSDGDIQTELLERSDRALYQSKARGKNRVSYI